MDKLIIGLLEMQHLILLYIRNICNWVWTQPKGSSQHEQFNELDMITDVQNMHTGFACLELLNGISCDFA
jgi:hypothetical protein